MIYVRYTLGEAMRSGNLLKPVKHRSTYTAETENSPELRKPALLCTDAQSRLQETPEQARRQAAYNEVRDCQRLLERIQYQSDDRENAYDEDLAQYKHGLKNGNVNDSRSELDRQCLLYGQELTRALINAEAAFDIAHERAEALGARASATQSSCWESPFEEEAEMNSLEQCGNSLDRSSIEDWRAQIPQCPSPWGHDRSQYFSDNKTSLVDISDSVSARDESRGRKRIDKWQETRGVYEGVNRRKLRGSPAHAVRKRYAQQRRR